MSFIVGSEVIPVNKSLVLHRILDKESISLSDLSKSCPLIPLFIMRVAKALNGETIKLDVKVTRERFLLFLKYCYIETLDERITCEDVSALADLAKQLFLPNLTALFLKKLEIMREHLRSELTKELIQKLVNNDHY
jgi:hypothetical protein